MRVVSLIPAATEILAEIGLDSELVGISGDSDWPVELEALPRVTLALPRRPGTSTARARLVAATHGLGTALGADLEAIAALAPDLLITQSRCRSCGVGLRPVELPAALAEVPVLDLEATSIEGIFNSITAVGAMTEAEDDAIDLVELLRARLRVIEEDVAERRFDGRPPARVVVLQRLDPPAAAGHWVPEQVRRAGGWDLLGEEGAASAETTWDAIAEVDPEFILLAPANLRITAARAAWERVSRPATWRGITAVRRGQVFLVDGPPYFGRPGPRVIDGIEMLAEILDPDHFVETSPPGSWTPIFMA